MSRFLLILAPAPSPVPVEIRLRAALKRLLRDHGMRAVDVREQIEAATPAANSAEYDRFTPISNGDNR